MYQYIAIGALLILVVVWFLFRLILYLMKQDTWTSPDPVIDDTNTDSSIAITEDGGVKKAPVYNHNVNKHAEQSRKLISNAAIHGKRVTSNSSNGSLKSRHSFGFTPSIRTIAPLTNRGRRNTQNFLMLLDSLDPIEDEEAKRRKRKLYTAASSSGIEANSSDETASQTLIGKELERDKDPGVINLDYIRSQASTK